MAESLTLLALFKEVDPTVHAIDRLRELGVPDEKLEIISGIPLGHEMLGRPKVPTFIPRLAFVGALVGLAAALFLTLGTPFLYPLEVGGQPVFPIPPSLIIGFELTMLGLMGMAFVGMFLAGRFPSFEPVHYVPEISDGMIALAFPCTADTQAQFESAMKSAGAEQVRLVEAKAL